MRIDGFFPSELPPLPVDWLWRDWWRALATAGANTNSHERRQAASPLHRLWADGGAHVTPVNLPI